MSLVESPCGKLALDLNGRAGLRNLVPAWILARAQRSGARTRIGRKKSRQLIRARAPSRANEHEHDLQWRTVI